MTVDITVTYEPWNNNYQAFFFFFFYTGAKDCVATETLAGNICADSCRVGKKTEGVQKGQKTHCISANPSTVPVGCDVLMISFSSYIKTLI